MKFYDAHNHLQDERLQPHLDGIIEASRASTIAKMVVNGSCEEDWQAVLSLAEKYPEVIPSFGYHPWYIKERTAQWKEQLSEFLETVPSAIGEIGLDRWIPDYDLPDQEEVFVWQLRLSAERQLPVSIHCLQAWGKMLEVLQREPRPAMGFILHSYGGPKEMVDPLAKLGAYFSFPGYFAHERKEKQREVFRHVPLERLLIETDAPDQSLPPDRVRFPLSAAGDGKPVNHPANLVAVYEFAAQMLSIPRETFASQIEENFHRVFGSLAS